jgi:hypothetical protein
MNVFNATARIRADKEDKKIRIDVYGVEEAAMRNKSPAKAFISYSHKDIDHLHALESALSPLKRMKNLELWYDRAIYAGSILYVSPEGAKYYSLGQRPRYYVYYMFSPEGAKYYSP